VEGFPLRRRSSERIRAPLPDRDDGVSPLYPAIGLFPGLWGGQGTNVNWTFVDSTAQFRSGVSQSLRLGSRNTANFELFYERYGVDVRAGAYYVSRNLFGFGGSTSADVYSEARTTVDLGASYAFTKNLSIYGNAKNLTNTPLKFTEGQPERPIQREFYGPTYQAGLQFNF
jgi:outer membrane receptor protein involved in Fe transport